MFIRKGCGAQYLSISMSFYSSENMLCKRSHWSWSVSCSNYHAIDRAKKGNVNVIDSNKISYSLNCISTREVYSTYKTQFYTTEHAVVRSNKTWLLTHWREHLIHTSVQVQSCKTHRLRKHHHVHRLHTGIEKKNMGRRELTHGAKGSTSNEWWWVYTMWRWSHEFHVEARLQLWSDNRLA